jgi:hypothetical protein
MSQNRNKLVDLLIGNLTNSIVHIILGKAINKPEINEKYRKELVNSFQIAKRYREKINPKESSFPSADIEYIKEKLIKRVRAELSLRISKGYQNINLNLIEPEVDKILSELLIR